MIFDAIRTPRGKGRQDGALYEVKPVQLLTGLLQALASRHDLDTKQVDDVVIGCVQPWGDQASCIGKTATLAAGWDWQVSGLQLDRYCGSGLEAINLAAMKIRSGWEDLVVAGGVESMSRVPMGSMLGSKDAPAVLLKMPCIHNKKRRMPAPKASLASRSSRSKTSMASRFWLRTKQSNPM